MAKKAKKGKRVLDRGLVVASIISIIGVFGFLFCLQFIDLWALIVPLACFFLIYQKYRKYFWKSYVIGLAIGFPLGMYFGFVYLWVVWGLMP